MEQMYQEVILDHYKHPHHRGLRDPFDAEVHHVNPTCGDEVTLRVRLSGDSDTVLDVSYDGQGCSISQASTSVNGSGSFAHESGFAAEALGPAGGVTLPSTCTWVEVTTEGY